MHIYGFRWRCLVISIKSRIKGKLISHQQFLLSNGGLGLLSYNPGSTKSKYPLPKKAGSVRFFAHLARFFTPKQ